ncbi:MAG TPA: hypothetical protein PLQ13_02270 [Candidatus Krumholzibacteria bacterium]|nr:hypothetical protein [Candidatus Krumholzibacteria bacterium]
MNRLFDPIPRLMVLAALALTGCSGGGAPLHDLAGTYVCASDSTQLLQLEPDGAFTFRSIGSHDGFRNVRDDVWIPPNPRVLCSGPSGRAVLTDEDDGAALAMTVTRTTDAALMQGVFAELGCADVDDLGYAGPQLAPGTLLQAALTREGDSQVTLLVPGSGPKGRHAPLTFVRRSR